MASNYDRAASEKKWQQFWRTEKIYRFDAKSDKKVYSIDNPPRYASGTLHAGHAVNYTQIDFAARYKRMQGYNVFFPLCFDTNGTPIEVQVEKKHGISIDQIPRQDFIKKCREFANSFIKEMTSQFEMLGESMDPELYYQTDSEDYRRLTQISFIRLHKKGLIYKGEFPVNWCPRCQTAVADAEVEHKHRTTKLNEVIFKDKDTGEDVIIATTRPELLCTCQLVAVHPFDSSKRKLVGRKLITPMFNREVPVVDDDKVDPDFGSGVVMICTIGDKDDLDWCYKYSLPMEMAIDEKGRMTSTAGKYEGMEIIEARKEIIEDLRKEGLLVKQHDLEQNVGVCWRCSTPIEFLQMPEWFLNIMKFKKEVLMIADQIDWHPAYMKQRLVDWVTSLAWDWPISRQRYFATPIPLWECTNPECGKVYLAEEEGCYVDPTITPPPVEKCEECGGEVEGCQDVFDTWMDSSISPLYNTFWERDPELFKKLYPMSLRPQAQDIIRTWAYYTILREWLLVKEKPWKEVMIGAYILSPDGTPMHASKGNTVDPMELIEDYGSDSVRYWAAMCGLGEDSPVNFKELTRGHRLGTKLWNVEQFIFKGLEGSKPERTGAVHTIDLWILGKYYQAVDSATKCLDDYEFDKAVKEIEYFIWHELADHYIEMVKHRLYAGDASARYTLYTIGLGIIKVLAPFMPHITEELYQQFYRQHEREKSIHIAAWPEFIQVESSAASAEIVREVIAAIRNWKSEKGMALNTVLESVQIAAPEAGLLQECADTITSTLKIKELNFINKDELAQQTVEVKPVFKNIGPTFKAGAKELTRKLRELDPKSVDVLPIKITLSRGKEVELGEEYVELRKGYVFHGEAVETLAVGDVLVVF